MTLPLVSVIIPGFNNEGRIGFALQSAINQDYENLEIIFVNDASKDDTLKNAEEVLKNSSRPYKIIIHEKNRGETASRNSGIDASSGEYICFCDGDDLMKENYVSTLYALSKKYDCDISCSGMLAQTENGTFARPIKWNVNQPVTGEQAAYRFIFKKGFMPHVCAMLYKRSFFEKINLRFTEGCICGGDMEFSRKALCRAERVSFTSEGLYVGVQSSESGTIQAQKSTEKQRQRSKDDIAANFRTAEYFFKYAKSRKIKFLIKNLYMPELAVKSFTHCAKFNEPEEYKELLKDTELKKILMRSFKIIFIKPEIFLKALIILLAPGFYYSVRNGK